MDIKNIPVAELEYHMRTLREHGDAIIGALPISYGVYFLYNCMDNSGEHLAIYRVKIPASVVKTTSVFSDLSWLIDWCIDKGYPIDLENETYSINMSVRFTSEGVVRNTHRACNEAYNPNLEELLAIIDDHEKLKEYINDFARSTLPISWMNQKAYGQIHLTKRLLTTA